MGGGLWSACETSAPHYCPHLPQHPQSRQLRNEDTGVISSRSWLKSYRVPGKKTFHCLEPVSGSRYFQALEDRTSLSTMATTALQGWHPGELAVQRKFGFADAVNDHWLRISNFLPEQHRNFHTSKIPFLPITTIDEDGRPWASVVAGLTGETGFVKCPDPQTLTISVGIWEGDPFLNTVKAWINPRHRLVAAPERFLIAGLGIDFATRRRNKFAGLIRSVSSTTESEYHFNLQVTEALG